MKPTPIAVFFAFVVALFLLLPLIAVVPVSFTPARFLSMPTDVWSLRHYQALLDNPAWLQSIWLSLRIGILSSVIATLLALMFSLGIWMFRPWFGSLLFGFVLLPMVAPPVVSAITLYFFPDDAVQAQQYRRLRYLGGCRHRPCRDDRAIRGCDGDGCAGAGGPADRSGRAGFWRFRPPAGIQGHPAEHQVRHLHRLLSLFVLSWEEIGVTLFITSVDAVTLPRMMWMGLRDNIDPAIAAISVILIAIVIAVILIKTAVTFKLSRKS